MKKQIEFPELENIRLDDKIQKTMQRDFPLPENVETAKNHAFEQIRKNRSKQEYADLVAAKARQRRRKKITFVKSCAGMVAAAAVFSAVCITNPAFAAQIPLVGHVFEEIGQSLGFSGDFSKYAKPLDDNTAETDNVSGDAAETISNTNEAAAEGSENADSGEPEEKTLYSQTNNGMTVTLSEVYCNDVALYVSMVIQTEDKFPDTLLMNDTDIPVIEIRRSKLKFSYNDRELLCGETLEGKMMDDHTYAAVLRYDLSNSNSNSDYDSYYEDLKQFYLELGITEEEMDSWSGKWQGEAEEKICALLGVDTLSDAAIVEAGGPDLNDYIQEVEIPDSFSVELKIPEIVGYKPDGATPEMPEDIRAEYEQAMEDNGLGLSDEDYENFTEEQKEIEHQLFTEMWNAYTERYPETNEYPNEYENWWVEGPWDFSFDVTKDSSETIVKEINDVNENGIGLISVTKTPFELTVEDGGNYDYFTVVLDADGDIMPTGTFGGLANVMAIQDRDISKIDIYICDYIEYMDELKGYYYSDDYEEKKQTKTFKELLDERAVYHKEVTFEE